MKKGILFFMFLFFMAGLSMAETEYRGSYESGQGPFKPKTPVKIMRVEEEYRIASLKSGGDIWNLPLSSLRGAIAATEGVWIYWFDGNEATLNAFIKMDKDVASLVNEINTVVSTANQKPMTDAEAEKYKDTFQKYQEEALKTAK